VGGHGVGENSSGKIGLQIFAEKMKICTYLHVGKHFFPAGYFIKTEPIPSACTVEFI